MLAKRLTCSGEPTSEVAITAGLSAANLTNSSGGELEQVVATDHDQVALAEPPPSRSRTAGRRSRQACCRGSVEPFSSTARSIGRPRSRQASSQARKPSMNFELLTTTTLAIAGISRNLSSSQSMIGRPATASRGFAVCSASEPMRGRVAGGEDEQISGHRENDTPPAPLRCKRFAEPLSLPHGGCYLSPNANESAMSLSPSPLVLVALFAGWVFASGQVQISPPEQTRPQEGDAAEVKPAKPAPEVTRVIGPPPSKKKILSLTSRFNSDNFKVRESAQIELTRLAKKHPKVTLGSGLGAIPRHAGPGGPLPAPRSACTARATTSS